MPITLNGTTGVTTPGATVGAITGILKATSGVVSQAVAGTDYLTSTSGGAITLATAQTATGTAVDFTGIPSWAKRITVMLNGVSTNGSSVIQIQIGAGSVTSTGYLSTGGYILNGSSSVISTYTSGFAITSQVSPTCVYTGSMVITLLGSNAWVANGAFARTDLFVQNFGQGSISLGGALDRIRITTVNGTDTFDAGTINISYE